MHIIEFLKKSRGKNELAKEYRDMANLIDDDIPK